MNEQQLREQLQKLSAELEQLPVTQEQRSTIEALVADIESQLAGGDADDSLVNQVETAVSSFEAEYPRLSGLLNNILVTLSSMGV